MNEIRLSQNERNGEHVVVNPIVYQPHSEMLPSPDDVEIIDLDQSRDEIKRTTWH